jgi:osmotically-inducible protein OsmY
MTQDLDQFSDEKLRAAILSRLATDDRTAFANLRVGVLNGIAHIVGVVSSLETYVTAAEIAESVHGVRGVVNRIEAPGAPSPSRTIHLDLPVTDAERTDDDKVPE